MLIKDCWKAARVHVGKGDIDKAIQVCESTPCASTVECRRFIGWTYYTQDKMDVALRWFGAAGETNDPEALFGMGSVYFTRHEFGEALQYYDRAASAGYVRAYSWAGYIHHQGLSVPRDLAKASDYYRKAASKDVFVAKRALIHIAFRHGNIFDRLVAIPRLVWLVVRTAFVAYRNPNDPRLADIRNAFDYSKRA